MNDNAELNRYFQLIKERPQIFTHSDCLRIVTDYDTLAQYSLMSHKKLGVVYESEYNMLLVDLIKDNDGSLYTYERIIPSATGTGVVCVTMFNGSFVMLKQYRHALREYQISFPRGYGENGLSAAQNAIKELGEEIGGVVNNVESLGSVAADGGLSGGKAEVLLCGINEFNAHVRQEGISEIFLMTNEQLAQAIKNNDINDAFTLAAYALFSEKKRRNK